MAPLLLPSAAMDSILSYCDTTDLARLAQINKTWQRIVYRKSVWEPQNIEYCHTDLMLPTPPRGARHIGGQTHICFNRWLTGCIHNNILSHVLPAYIHHTEDPKKYMERAYKFWTEHGKPCFILQHHHVCDVLIAPLPKGMSRAERTRILYQLVKARKSVSKNAYATYLLTQIAYNHTFPELPVPLLEADATPLARLRHATLKLAQDRAAQINAFNAALQATYTHSAQLLTAHGFAEFEANDTWFRGGRDAAWSAAGFSYVK
jgi:hypothetical protein